MREDLERQCRDPGVLDSDKLKGGRRLDQAGKCMRRKITPLLVSENSSPKFRINLEFGNSEARG